MPKAELPEQAARPVHFSLGDGLALILSLLFTATGCWLVYKKGATSLMPWFVLLFSAAMSLIFLQSLMAWLRRR